MDRESWVSENVHARQTDIFERSARALCKFLPTRTPGNAKIPRMLAGIAMKVGGANGLREVPTPEPADGPVAARLGERATTESKFQRTLVDARSQRCGPGRERTPPTKNPALMRGVGN